MSETVRESVTLAGRAERARVARTFVGEVLGPGHPCGDVAILLVSELFSNSIRHSQSGAPGETVTVALRVGDGVVRVEVTDRSGLEVPELLPADGGAEGGRGLGLVAWLAARWGWRRRGGRTVTWFELRDAGDLPPGGDPGVDPNRSLRECEDREDGGRRGPVPDRSGRNLDSGILPCVPNDSGVTGEDSLQVTRLIRECRKASGLTQEELAHRSGVPFSAISEYEADGEAPPIGVLREIISATGHSACSTSGSLAADAGRMGASLVPEAWWSGQAAEDESPEEQVARLRARVEAHLTSLGFQVSNGCLLAPVAKDKDQLRELHTDAAEALRERSRRTLARHEDQFITRLAHGPEIVPERITPVLVPVVDRRGFEGLLWRWCSLHWSIPVSSGYGRRMRFLVVDRGHGDKVIGLIGLADPVFALSCRDSAIGWSREWRKERLFSVMDAFVLGAVPPYNALCGGKLVAMLATSSEVRDAFSERYRDHVTLIAQRRADARLVLVTTSSALGRSSVYNRLNRPDGNLAFRPVGYTSGTGDFHFSGSIYKDLADYAARNTPTGVTQRHARWTGQTFRNRREVIQRALDGLGYDSRKLRIHGVRRQVFLAPLAANALDWLRGESQSLDWSTLDCGSLGTWWLQRWAIRRAARVQDWQRFDPESWRLYG